MGLKDLAEESDTSSNSSNSNTTASNSPQSGSSSDGKKLKRVERVPYMAAIRKASGELKFKNRPQHYPLEFSHKSDGVKNPPDAEQLHNASWDLVFYPEQMERYWMSKEDYELLCSRVKEYLGKDLRSLQENNPEGALKAIRSASRRAMSGGRKKNRFESETYTRDCGVCGDGINVHTDPHTEVGNRLVCDDHSAKELAESGLID